jgi:hypothetical protein
MMSAIGTALAQSTMSSQNYPPLNTEVSFESSNLPLIWIKTTGTLSRTERILGFMKVINNPENLNYTDTVQHNNQNVEFDGPIAIKWRGSSSFGSDESLGKKPMSIKTLKTTDINGKKDKVELLGLGKDNDWCLLAPWHDGSYIRDVLTMQLARNGYAFAPQMRYCEVFVDTIYYGVYILCERATKGKHRLNIWDFKEDADGNAIEDTSGDFHVEIDRPYNNFTLEADPHYTSQYHPVYTDGTELTNKYITYQYKDPDPDDFTSLPDAQESIDQAIDEMEGAFASSDYKELYPEYIDMYSWMDYEIAQELANNIDAYRLSTPMWKYSRTHALTTGDNDKWKLALWDFNFGYVVNNNDHMQPSRAEWRYTANDILVDDVLDKDELIPFYWQKLMEDETYVNQLKGRYTQLRKGNYTIENINAICDSITTLLDQGAPTHDHEAWVYLFGNWKAQIEKVKQFIFERMEWMDERWYDESLLSKVSLVGTTFWKDASWNTLCLPFNLSCLEGTPLEGATIRTLVNSDLNDGVLTLNFTEGNITSIEAGKPYIIKWTGGDNIQTPVFSNQVIATETPTPIETDYVDFVGTLSPQTLNKDDYSVLYLGSSNTLYYPAANVPLNAFHAYFKLKNCTASPDEDQKSSIKSIQINIDDASSLSSVNVSNSPDSNLYSIDGLRLNAPNKNQIFISGEQKIIIK